MRLRRLEPTVRRGSSLRISACSIIVYRLIKDKRIQKYTLTCSLNSPGVFFCTNTAFYLLIVVSWTCLMAAKEVMGRKDINYAKAAVRGKENVDSTTEPLRKGQFTSTPQQCFFFLRNCFRHLQNAFSISFNSSCHPITQGLIRCNAKMMIISLIPIHFQFWTID